MNHAILVDDEPIGNKRLAKMLNDPDDNHLEPEEGEYHFSDDDISYEVETEQATTGSSATSAAGIMGQINRYRRAIISTVVFLLLFFVVYKMVMPSSDEQTTDIMPIPAQPVNTVQQRSVDTKSAQPQQQSVVAASSQTLSQAQPQPTEMAPQPVQQAPAAQMQQQQAASLPAVSPGQQPTMATTAAQPSTTGSVAVQTMSPQVDGTVAQMALTNEKLMMQLQAEYSQRLAEYAQQNKALQSDMQQLSAKVVGLESDIKRLVQEMTAQRIANEKAAVPAPQAKPQPTVKVDGEPQTRELPIVENNSGFTVQAIIPGRAWLKAKNGETITVTEGDKIKGMGRVIKIDPYDGVVQVNTGSKIISISYGNNE